MPGWLLWTLVGLGTWCAVSVPVAFLLAGLFGRTRARVSRLVAECSSSPAPRKTATGIARAPGR
jgi:hypothetical protein